MKRISTNIALVLSVTLGGITLTGCNSLNPFSSSKSPTQSGIPKESEAAYFQTAQKHIEKQRFIEAEKALEDLRTFYPVGFYSKQALLDLIYVKFMKDEYQQTVLLADRFIKNYPDHAQVDYAYYAKGLASMHGGFSGLMKYTNLNQAHRDTSFLRAAFNDFQNLSQRFPNSRYTPDAIERMYYIYDQFAEHEMNVARFNIKRKAYMGAIERAKMVFLGFPQSRQTPEAVATLAYCYHKIGMEDHATKYRKILQANYPHLLNGNKVRLSAARSNASWLNRFSLGLFGRASQTAVITPKNSSLNNPALNKPAPKIPELQSPELKSPALNNADNSNADNSNADRVMYPSTNITLGLGLPVDEKNNEANTQ